MDNIALASNDQATSIMQINQGIGQISNVTQTNSATSQESAAISQELSDQAQYLKEMVGSFVLDDKLNTTAVLLSSTPNTNKAVLPAVQSNNRNQNAYDLIGGFNDKY